VEKQKKKALAGQIVALTQDTETSKQTPKIKATKPRMSKKPENKQKMQPQSGVDIATASEPTRKSSRKRQKKLR
jgi:hypothetical protein